MGTVDGTHLLSPGKETDPWLPHRIWDHLGVLWRLITAEIAKRVARAAIMTRAALQALDTRRTVHPHWRSKLLMLSKKRVRSSPTLGAFLCLHLLLMTSSDRHSMPRCRPCPSRQASESLRAEVRLFGRKNLRKMHAWMNGQDPSQSTPEPPVHWARPGPSLDWPGKRDKKRKVE